MELEGRIRTIGPRSTSRRGGVSFFPPRLAHVRPYLSLIVLHRRLAARQPPSGSRPQNSAGPAFGQKRPAMPAISAISTIAGLRLHFLPAISLSPRPALRPTHDAAGSTQQRRTRRSLPDLGKRPRLSGRPAIAAASTPPKWRHRASARMVIRRRAASPFFGGSVISLAITLMRGPDCDGRVGSGLRQETLTADTHS